MSDVLELLFKIPVKDLTDFPDKWHFKGFTLQGAKYIISECNLPPSTCLKPLTQILGKLLS